MYIYMYTCKHWMNWSVVHDYDTVSDSVTNISAITDHNLLVMANSNIVEVSNIINKQIIETAQQRYCVHTHTR